MRVPRQGTGAEQPVVAKKSPKGDGAKGLRHPARTEGQPRQREEPEDRAKPFRISKRVVWEAYKRVKANKCQFAAPCRHMICNIMPPEGLAETTGRRMPRMGFGVDRQMGRPVHSRPAGLRRSMPPLGPSGRGSGVRRGARPRA
jgi:hypothetical protein